jgi:DnaK suppressor protein
MSNLSKNQIDTLRDLMGLGLARLVDETRSEMNLELKTHYIDIDGDVADDEIAADVIVDIDNAIIGLHLQKARDLNAALDRIELGIYGTCIDCNGNIDSERLYAHPTAKRCIRCQRLHEKTFAS